MDSLQLSPCALLLVSCLMVPAFSCRSEPQEVDVVELQSSQPIQVPVATGIRLLGVRPTNSVPPDHRWELDVEVEAGASGTWLVVARRQMGAPAKSAMEEISGEYIDLRGPVQGNGWPQSLVAFYAFSVDYGSVAMYPIPPHSKLTAIGIETITTGHEICFDLLLADDVRADTVSVLPGLEESAAVRMWVDLYRGQGKQRRIQPVLEDEGLGMEEGTVSTKPASFPHKVHLDFVAPKTQRLCVARFRPSIPL